jgi:hypothetical protein
MPNPLLRRRLGGGTGWRAGLVAAYTFQDPANLGLDSAGGNHLTNNNAATSVAGRVGLGVGLASASSQSLSRASNPSLVMAGTSWELTCFLKFTSRPGAGSFPGIVGKWGASGLEFLLYYDGTLSRMRGLATADNSTTVTVEHTNGPADGTWYFLDLWHDLPAGTLHLNVDNAPAVGGPTAALTGTYAGTSAFVVGSTDFGAPFLNGAVDSVNLWKRLLTPAERTQLYSGREFPYS